MGDFDDAVSAAIDIGSETDMAETVNYKYRQKVGDFSVIILSPHGLAGIQMPSFVRALKRTIGRQRRSYE